MPEETEQAVSWALVQRENEHELKSITELVRDFFNENNIQYESFRKKDLEPFIG